MWVGRAKAQALLTRVRRVVTEDPLVEAKRAHDVSDALPELLAGTPSEVPPMAVSVGQLSPGNSEV